MHRDGRFEESMDVDAAEYSGSLDDDARIFNSVVVVNKAHVSMLAEEDIISDSDAEQILSVLSDLEGSNFDDLDLDPELEDIHMVIEERVKGQVGEEVGGRMHTAKSRNDQVTASIRMVLREDILEIQELLVRLLDEMQGVMEENLETIMPGYTHLQVAEPTTFAHYLGNYVQAYLRSLERLDLTYDQTNRNPLGACAFAGTSFEIDREYTTDLLGFDEVLENTMDATGSRDFVLDALSNMSVLMTELSRFSEEMVLWNSAEFDMVSLPDEFASTSSIMPQKKNPVIPEIVRAKSGETVGDLVGGLGMMKNLPQAYNLDIQELTPLLWNSVENVKSTLKMMIRLVEGLEPKEEKMRDNTKKGFASLTELANSLVKEADLPFRKSHQIVGALALKGEKEDKGLEDITVDDFQSVSREVLGEEVDFSKEELENALDLDECTKRKRVEGGPSPEQMENELNNFSEKIESYRDSLKGKRELIEDSRKKLENLS